MSSGLEKSASVIKTRKEWQLTLAEGRRKIPYGRILSVDGADKTGQFCITTVHDTGRKEQVVVTSSFLKDAGTKKAKLLFPKLFRIGAPVITKPAEGLISQRSVAGNMGGVTVMGMYKTVYTDLCAVLTEADEAEWASEGLI